MEMFRGVPRWRVVRDAIVFLLCVLLLVVGLLLATKAKADEGPHAYVDGLVTKWATPPNDLWWQDGYAHSDDYSSVGVRAGIVVPLSPRFAVSASGFDLGSYSMSAWATPDEDCYLALGASHVCHAPVLIYTSGGIRGVSLTGLVYPFEGGLFLEAGPTYYSQRFDLSIVPVMHHTESLSGPGWMAGAGYEGKDWRVSLSVYQGNVGGGFKDSEYPAGTGNVITFGFGRVVAL